MFIKTQLYKWEINAISTPFIKNKTIGDRSRYFG